MMNINSVLREYRNGDFENRLSLFLNYRDIRQEFIEIDKSESSRKDAKSAEKQRRISGMLIFSIKKLFFALSASLRGKKGSRKVAKYAENLDI